MRRKYFIPGFILLLILALSNVGFAQEDMWQVLANVGFETKPSRETGFEIESPIFSKYLKSWNGKKITIKGYLIPLSEMGGRHEYMLSALPFNQCYFCGGAGPETVIEVQAKEKIKFVTRQISMEGILVLNDSDPDHHMYILKDVKLVE